MEKLHLRKRDVAKILLTAEVAEVLRRGRRVNNSLALSPELLLPASSCPAAAEASATKATEAASTAAAAGESAPASAA